MNWRTLFPVVLFGFCGLLDFQPVASHPFLDVTGYREQISQADRYFVNLQFREASGVYQKIMQRYPVRDTAYYRMVNHLIECQWAQQIPGLAEITARKHLPMAVSDLGSLHPLTGKLYMNLAITCFVTSTPAMSEEYFTKALQIAIHNHGMHHPFTATVYEWLGVLYESRNRRDLCLHALNRSLECWHHVHPTDHPDMGNVYRYFGLYYKRCGQTDSALHFLNIAQSLFDQQYGPNNYQSVKCLNNKADVYEAEKQMPIAAGLYREALRRIRLAKGETKMAHLMTYYNMGEHAMLKNDPVQALLAIQKIFPLFFPDFTDLDDVEKNPLEIDSVWNFYLKLSYTFKSMCLRKAFEQDPGHRISYLISAEQCDSIVSRIDCHIKSRIINQDNLLEFEHQNAIAYNNYASNAITLYSLTGDPVYFSKALAYLEQNRNNPVIHHPSHSANARSIPANLMSDLTHMKEEISGIRRELSLISDTEKKKILEDQLLEKKIALDQWYYFAFTQNKGHRKATDPVQAFMCLDSIQKKLDSRTVLLDIIETCPNYYFTPEQFLLICLTQTDVAYCFYDGLEFFPQLNRFYQLVSSPGSSAYTLDSVSGYLYQKMIHPFESLLAGKENLIIIPSMNSWKIPFEALSVPTTNPTISAEPLITRFCIHKEYSLVSWYNAGHTLLTTKPTILAVAPKFNHALKTYLARLTNRDTNLIDLPGSRRECLEISELFQTKLLIGYDATKTNLISHIHDHPILHISTHGISAKEDENLLMLVFNEEGEKLVKDNYVSMHDIINLNLHSELVVLSACRSASGELNKSEGTLNLGWAFTQAGAGSVVVSLWDVNDYASSTIMPDFYRSLADGLPKAAALRKAKLDFIRLSDHTFRHPYFWAGFDLIGDDRALQVKPTNSWYTNPWLLGLALLILIPVALFGKTILKK